ncbi:MAG TPA: alpha/beta fold hydrolase, partial [Planctomycetaceae bacterium]|nr:alpha/beta fold hydrolase [Planctomycetaceae bacterium]
MIWPLGVIIGLIAIAEVAANWWAVRVIFSVIDTAPPFNVEPHPPNEAGKPISFPTTHGLTLRGSLYRQTDQPSRGLIIFCHELGGNHWSALSYCEGLWEAGFDILAFDFRNQGESDALPGYEPLHWLTCYEVQDVLSAIRFVRQDDQLARMPLGLFGISRGGGAALAAGALTPSVRCVACEGAFAMEDVV